MYKDDKKEMFWGKLITPIREEIRGDKIVRIFTHEKEYTKEEYEALIERKERKISALNDEVTRQRKRDLASDMSQNVLSMKKLLGTVE